MTPMGEIAMAFVVTTLVSFNFGNGAEPDGSLIADANGDLFGTTQNGGANGDGAVFEIAKTATGYASTPTILVSFNGANGNGANPLGSLIADANGDLFGTTANGGANGDGAVFEIADSGFVSLAITGTVVNQAVNDNATIDPFAHVVITDLNAGQTETVTITPSNIANGTLSDPNAATDGSAISNGVYAVTGTAAAVTADLDALVFHPTDHQVAPGSTVTTGFTIAVTDTAGQTASDSATSVVATAVATPAEVNTWFQTIDGLPPTTASIPANLATAYVEELNATPQTATPVQIQADLENFPFNPTPPPTNIATDTFYRTSVADFVLREFQAAWGVVPTTGAGSQYDNWVARIIADSTVTNGAMSQALAGTPEFMAKFGTTSATQPASAGFVDQICESLLAVAPGPGAEMNIGLPVWQVLQNFAQSSQFITKMDAPIANFQNLLLAGETPTGSDMVQLTGVSLNAHIHAFV
jgi:uncharacterized repeat protein (TIGR03803 family)